MANGAAARLPLEPASASAIGEAAANAATALCAALEEYGAGGRLSPATRDAGGDRIARLVELQQGMPAGTDFAALMRREGKAALRQRHGAAFRQQHGADMNEAVLDGILADLLEIVVNVSKIARAMAH